MNLWRDTQWGLFWRTEELPELSITLITFLRVYCTAWTNVLDRSVYSSIKFSIFTYQKLLKINTPHLKVTLQKITTYAMFFKQCFIN